MAAGADMNIVLAICFICVGLVKRRASPCGRGMKRARRAALQKRQGADASSPPRI